MVSRLLVPMDDSPRAGKALEYAFDNFPDATVSVIHVVGVPSPMMGDAASLALADDLEAAANEAAAGIFDRAREIATERSREIDTIVAIGHPTREILDRAEGYDTIVIGAHGSDRVRAARQFLVGNVAETVSKRAPIPVVLVR